MQLKVVCRKPASYSERHLRRGCRLSPWLIRLIGTMHVRPKLWTKSTSCSWILMLRMSKSSFQSCMRYHARELQKSNCKRNRVTCVHYSSKSLRLFLRRMRFELIHCSCLLPTSITAITSDAWPLVESSQVKLLWATRSSLYSATVG